MKSGNQTLYKPPTREITVSNAGTYRIWVRAMIHSSVSSNKNSWKFHVGIDDTTLETVFGGGGAESQTYIWQDGGTISLSAGTHNISIIDTYATYAKFNGVLITNNTTLTPSDDLATFESQLGIQIQDHSQSAPSTNATSYLMLPSSFASLGNWTQVDDDIAIDGKSLIGSKSGDNTQKSNAEATLINVPAGTYRIWVHARELPNTSSLNNAWQFRVSVNGIKLSNTFGGGGKSIPETAYFWRDGGKINLREGVNIVALVDEWCNYAKCDAIYITSDRLSSPANATITDLKNNSIIVSAQDLSDYMENFTITDQYAGGNITVISRKNNHIELDNKTDPNPGSDPLFYWNFQATSDTARTVTFEFNEEKTHSSGYLPDLIGNEKVLYSTDGGVTWNYTKAANKTSFSFAFEAGQTVRFCNVLPYVLSNYERFVEQYKNNANAEFTTLREKAEELGIAGSFISEEGRDMPLVVIGNPNAKKCIVFTARNHACETTGSYTLEGILEYMINDAPADFLNEYCIYAVPMVDIDGVENGEQGKGRRGQSSTLDHNRDYGIGYYPETVAVTTFFTAIFENQELAAFVDSHSPGAIADANGNYLSVPKTDGVNPNGTAYLENMMAPKADRYSDILNSLEDGDSAADKLTYNPAYAWRAYGAPGQARIWFAQFEPQLSLTVETSFTATPSDHTPDNVGRWGWTVGQAVRLFLTVDEEPAKNVVALIDKIGKVSLESESVIADARKAYDELTEDQKLLVSNYEALVEAEKELERLLNKNDDTKMDWMPIATSPPVFWR